VTPLSFLSEVRHAPAPPNAGTPSALGGFLDDLFDF
jgi:hypothetical protein